MTGSLIGGSGATIAFESIDGPPPDVFHKLVQNLKDEAQRRQLAVVSREGQAAYRVRGYLAANILRGKTSIAWAWDVYDNDQRRTLRVTGEEKAGPAGRNAWGAADDEVLRRVARSGMDRIAAYLGASGTTEAVATRAPAAGPEDRVAPEPSRSVLSSVGFDDFRPEAAGIFRIFRGEPGSAEPDISARAVNPVPAEVPLPRRRPRQAPRPTMVGAAPAIQYAALPLSN